MWIRSHFEYTSAVESDAMAGSNSRSPIDITASPMKPMANAHVTPEFTRAIEYLATLIPRDKAAAGSSASTAAMNTPPAASAAKTPAPKPTPPASADTKTTPTTPVATAEASPKEQKKGQLLCAQDWAYSRTDTLIHKHLLKYGSQPVVVRPGELPDQHVIVYKVPSTDGEEITSKLFPVNRGVIQGDVISPLYFILALELILRRHDNVTGKGIDFESARVSTLGYADDAALLDDDREIASQRVSAIAQGSERDADMSINISKTEVMHVREQGRVSQTTPEEAKNVCKYVCPNAGCNKVFANAHGCKVHAGRCRMRDIYIAEKILKVKGETGSPKRRFLVRWEGYDSSHDTWEPRKNLQRDLVNSFLLANNLYDHEWHGERCPRCDQPCKSAFGVKVHLRHCILQPEEKQHFKGTCADIKVKHKKLSEAQDAEPKIKCGKDELKNIFLFKYLGSIFAADGTQHHDVRRRIALATARMGQLRQLFNSDIRFGIKMRIYKTAICSLLTYGCEAWDLNARTAAMINGANTRLLSRFTGENAHQEASARTRSFDLVKAIQERRFVWLGHLLRLKGNRLVKLSIIAQFKRKSDGGFFMDLPPNLSFEEIKAMAADRKAWRTMAECAGDKAAMKRCINDIWPENPDSATSMPNRILGRWVGTGLDRFWVPLIQPTQPTLHTTQPITTLHTTLPNTPHTNIQTSPRTTMNTPFKHTHENTLWAEPAHLPSDLSTPTQTSTLWAEPAHYPSDISTPTQRTTSTLWAEPAHYPSDVSTPPHAANLSPPLLPTLTLWAEPAHYPSDISTPPHATNSSPPLLPTPTPILTDLPPLLPTKLPPLLLTIPLSPIPTIQDMMNQTIL